MINVYDECTPIRDSVQWLCLNELPDGTRCRCVVDRSGGTREAVAVGSPAFASCPKVHPWVWPRTTDYYDADGGLWVWTRTVRPGGIPTRYLLARSGVVQTGYRCDFSCPGVGQVAAEAAQSRCHHSNGRVE